MAYQKSFPFESPQGGFGGCAPGCARGLFFYDSYQILPHWTFKVATVKRFYHIGSSKVRQFHRILQNPSEFVRVLQSPLLLWILQNPSESFWIFQNPPESFESLRVFQNPLNPSESFRLLWILQNSSESVWILQNLPEDVDSSDSFSIDVKLNGELSLIVVKLNGEWRLCVPCAATCLT